MGSITKDAMRDAAEYAAARMAYGEGAGTRRKLIVSAVEFKAERVPGYRQAFEKALNSQDITKHIKHAKRNRKISKTTKAISRNTKAIARGDRNGMSTPIIVLAVVWGVAYRTGYDKKIYHEAKLKLIEARLRLRDLLDPDK